MNQRMSTPAWVTLIDTPDLTPEEIARAEREDAYIDVATWVAIGLVVAIFATIAQVAS